jgi:hypothetical protein
MRAPSRLTFETAINSSSRLNLVSSHPIGLIVSLCRAKAPKCRQKHKIKVEMGLQTETNVRRLRRDEIDDTQICVSSHETSEMRLPSPSRLMRRLR